MKAAAREPMTAPWRTFRRMSTIAGIVTLTALLTLPVVLALLLRGDRDGARTHAFRMTTRMLQWLGPTFVKAGQLSSCRGDALPPSLCDELSVLHDAVRPMTRRQVRRALTLAFGPGYGQLVVHIDWEPLGSGSIAGVYRALLAGGGDVALKLKRPGIDSRMHADLVLLQQIVRRAERLPAIRDMPMGDLVGYVSGVIAGQLDFERERDNLVRLRASLDGFTGVSVPDLYPAYSTGNCLALEFMPGLDAMTPLGLSGEDRAAAATTALLMARKMMFGDGFVHCDLHPGNLYVRPGGEIVVLDAGYCVQLSDGVRLLIAEFFRCLTAGDGRRCGEIILRSAVNVTPTTDTEGFVDALSDLVRRSTPSDGLFDMPTFGQQIFALSRDYRIYSSSDFFFPLMALMTLEGTARTIWPQADLRVLGGEAASSVGTGTGLGRGQDAELTQ